jgi:hypothetical protein
VIRWTSVLLVGTSLSLTSVPAIAMAGDLAPTSRSTAFISITIPPHLWMSRAPLDAKHSGGPDEQFFCISNSHQTDSYRLAVISPTSGKSGGTVPLELNSQLARQARIRCGVSGSAFAIPRTDQGHSPRMLDAPSENPTLLVIPN